MVFGCGVVPMASLLILVALFSIPNLVRGARCSPFVFGFEVLGWAAVFAVITCFSVGSPILMAYLELISSYARPIFIRYLVGSPGWVAELFELGAIFVIFSLPQLLVALLGGWVNHKFGFTLRFERQGRGPAMPASESTSEAARPDRLPVEQARLAAAAVAE